MLLTKQLLLRPGGGHFLFHLYMFGNHQACMRHVIGCINAFLQEGAGGANSVRGGYVFGFLFFFYLAKPWKNAKVRWKNVNLGPRKKTLEQTNDQSIAVCPVWWGYEEDKITRQNKQRTRLIKMPSLNLISSSHSGQFKLLKITMFGWDKYIRILNVRSCKSPCTPPSAGAT